MRNASFLCVATAAAFVAPATASANCAALASYFVKVTPDRVVICPHNFDGRDCSASDVLLRQDVETGTVVALPSMCCVADGSEGDATGGEVSAKAWCYSDTCVAPGRYRYGFQTPYECHPHSCSTDFYEEVDVTTELTACTPAPSVVSSAPWKDSPSICPSTYRGASGCMAGGADVVLSLNALALLAGCVVVLRRRRTSAGR